MSKRAAIPIEDVFEPYPMKRRTPLSNAYPEIAACWCFAKNCGFGPEDFSSGSGIKAWWICADDERHPPFQQVINQRVRSEKESTVYGKGCPYCASKKVCETNSLEKLAPLIAAEWHPTKNGNLTPAAVTAQCNQFIWWLCSTCGQDWKSLVSNRISVGSGCPLCHGKAACYENCLATLRPDIAKEWHPTKNYPLTPSDVTVGCNTHVLWLCTVNAEHEWTARILDRTNYNTGCPKCKNRIVSDTNSLAYLYPEVAREWHPTRNKTLKPTEVLKGSGKRVWWQCQFKHEWQDWIYSRTSKGAKCPTCLRVARAQRPHSSIVSQHSERINELLAKGKSRAFIADTLGVHPSTLSKFLKATRDGGWQNVENHQHPQA